MSVQSRSAFYFLAAWVAGLGVLWGSPSVFAQPPEDIEETEAPEEGEEVSEPVEEAPEEPEEPEPVEVEPPEEPEEPELRPAEGEPVENFPDDADLPSPDDALDRLAGSAPEGGGATGDGWTAPQPVFGLHGYFRVRGELQDSFNLGRGVGADLSGVDPPFDRFVPFENGVIPDGGCGDDPETGTATSACDTETLRYANMRLRLEPTLSLSEDVRVHMQLDVFDNLVLGSTPEGAVYEIDTASSSVFSRVERTPRVPLDSFAASQQPPEAYRNGLTDSIRVRRAWAEVTNRGLGQLRFGRMGSHWGLGLLANGGDGIDSDYQTDVDRIMAVTQLAGFYFIGAFDFANEGYVRLFPQDQNQLAFDAAQDDDVDQFVFAVARRTDEEEQEERLQRGGFVLNGGVYFVYRSQKLTTSGISSPFREAPRERPTVDNPVPGVSQELVRRGAEAFIPDVWVQFMYGGLRIEAEAVFIAGSIENAQNSSSFELDDFDILQFGFALEAEYRLLDDKLGIYFDTGLATGDEDVEGLTVTAGLPAQNDDNTVSTFRFHPNYRIDLILWRTVMQQIAGAYYFKPGISYDFIRNSFGQLLGLRADLIYSRAVAPIQTWGNDPDLGVEINATLYYRSEDGPELLDGFYGQLQYGILFPLAGLGSPEGADTQIDLSTAQTVRLILGVQY